MTAVLARRLGWTEGQVATTLLGIVVALVLAAIGIPPTLEDRPDTRSAFQAPGPALSPSAVEPPPEQTGAPAVAPETAAPLPTEGAVAPTQSSASVGISVEPTPAAPTPPPRQVSLLARVGAPGSPEGVVVAANGDVFVVTNNDRAPSKVFRFTAGGFLVRSFDVSGQPETRPAGLTGLGLDQNGALITLDGGTGRVLRIDPGTGTQTVVTTLIDLPACGVVVLAAACEPGQVDHKPLPRGVAVDQGGNIYVTDAGQSTIFRIASGASQAQPWHSSADYGGNRQLAGIAIEKDGRLVFAAGDIWRLVVGPASAGERTSVAKLGADDRPVGVAVMASGEIAVALAGANQILVLGPDGTAQSRIATAPGDEIALDAPSGVVARGATLLVTNQSATGDSSRWAVLEVRR